MDVYGYDPHDWSPRQWLTAALERIDDGFTAGVVILLSDHADWPPWSVDWLYRSMTMHAQPLTIVSDLGQFSPNVWCAWNTLRVLLARRAWGVMAAPVPEWPQYARALGVPAKSLEVGEWLELDLTCAVDR